MLRDSPNAVIHQGAAGIRRRLQGPGAWLDFPVLKEYVDAGSTDYVCMHLPFSDGSRCAIAFAR